MKPRLDDETKRRAVSELADNGYPAVAKEYGVSVASLRSWRKQFSGLAAGALKPRNVKAKAPRIAKKSAVQPPPNPLTAVLGLVRDGHVDVALAETIITGLGR